MELQHVITDLVFFKPRLHADIHSTNNARCVCVDHVVALAAAALRCLVNQKHFCSGGILSAPEHVTAENESESSLK